MPPPPTTTTAAQRSSSTGYSFGASGSNSNTRRASSLAVPINNGAELTMNPSVTDLSVWASSPLDE